eukprot:TRINITY_DN1133_c0_g3_i2.p1 TRINITY_DN1133_c0_g3~~TRINITY_DN1133_c0_g3_i2.p1  ORF type:complete len:297 (+),score=63.52 TRINITY_DN1133_c0_g3_i2:112-1002(+)
MTLTYYLILQDRIKEARETFGKVKLVGKEAEPDTEMRLQYDYLASYLDFFGQDLKVARSIVPKYKDYPVDKWNKLFLEVANKLKEVDEGSKTEVADILARDQKQTKLAEAEPNLDIHIEAKKITLDYQNLSSVTVHYYKMDIELLFSTSPFVQQNFGHFSYIMPNRKDVITLNPKETSYVIEIPEEFHTSNVMVDVVGAGIQRTQAYYSNSLFVNVIENYGQLKVNSKKSGKPLPKVYVKVYARSQDGEDGYTDLTGRFDYTSLMTNQLERVEKFSILVVSTEEGSVIKEANPPKI